MPIDAFLRDIDTQIVGRAPGTGVWLTKVEHGISPMILHHVRQNAVLQ